MTNRIAERLSYGPAAWVCQLLPRSARVSDPAETADRRSPGDQETFGQPGGSVGRPARAPWTNAAAWVCLLATAGIVLAEDSRPKIAVAITVGSNASSAEKVAANDLAESLQRLYPQQAFDRGSETPPAGRCILL